VHDAAFYHVCVSIVQEMRIETNTEGLGPFGFTCPKSRVDVRCGYRASK